MAAIATDSGADDFQLSLIDVDHAGGRVRVRKTELNIREVGRWARRQSRDIAMSKNVDWKSSHFLLAQTVKLGEELGELYAEVLGVVRLQRESKCDRYSNDSLEGELADVLICTSILAELLNVDLTKALEEKMAIVEERMSHTKATG